jgi:hypothetical protein
MTSTQAFRLTIASAAFVLIVSVTLLPSRSEAVSDLHHSEIWGSLHTQERSTANIFKNVAIYVRELDGNRMGQIVASTEILNRLGEGLDDSDYAVKMGNLPAGKYLVQVIPVDGSEYQPGGRIVNYRGKGTSTHQDWTINLTVAAVPAKE